MSFQIESGINPVSSPRGRKPTEFPFDEMDVGQSFLITLKTNEDGSEFLDKDIESWRRKLRIGIKRFNETGDGKFQTAITSDGLRVWRVA